MEGDTIRWNDKWHSSTALYTLDDDRCDEGAFRDNNLYDGRLSPRAPSPITIVTAVTALKRREIRKGGSLKPWYAIYDHGMYL